MPVAFDDTAAAGEIGVADGVADGTADGAAEVDAVAEVDGAGAETVIGRGAGYDSES